MNRDATEGAERIPHSRVVARRTVGFLSGVLLSCIGLCAGQAQTPDENRTLLIHSDESYESTYAAELEECVPPDYGSFAERYEGSVRVLAIVLDLTQIMWWDSHPLDAYVWSDDGGIPGGVLALVPDYDALWVGDWPQWRRVVVELPSPICTGAEWWVGYWGVWPGWAAHFGVCADLDGPGGGSPMYKIAPGLEWPEGWQDVSVRWGSTAALGIGAEVDETPSPVVSPTWGEVKSLFR